MTETVRETTMISVKQHMSNEMWTGSKKLVEKSFYTVNTVNGKPKFVRSNLTYTPALYKSIDEIIVNAVDHYSNHPDKVKSIRISYNAENGVVQVINDGPGIPVYKIEIKRDKTGEPTVRHLQTGKEELTAPTKDAFTVIKWFPQWISEEPLTSNNYGERKVHLTGGLNGAGMKLANYLSEAFMIETIDGLRNLKYQQIMENGASVIRDPVITPVPAGTKTYTSITFKPNYKYLKYPNPSPRDFAIIEKLVKTRAYQVASYCPVDVYYNNELLTVKNIVGLGEMFAPELKTVNIEKIADDVIAAQDAIVDVSPIAGLNLGEMKLEDFVDAKGKKQTSTTGGSISEKRTYAYSCQLKTNDHLDANGNPLIWHVCVGPSMSEKFEHMSIVNGIYIIEGGCHIDWITSKIVDYFEKEIAKTTELLDAERNRIKNNLYIVMVCQINLANISLEGQTKERIVLPKKDYAGYTFTDRQLKEIWNICEPFVISDILEKSKGKRKNKKVVIDKYYPAKYSKDRKKMHDCTLFIPEGDSASTLIRQALSDKDLPKFTQDYYGYYNIQGVPMNVRNFSKLMTNPRTGEKYMLYSNAIRENERLEGLYQILGLDETKSYDLTAGGDKDFRALNYGSVIIATDQDEDGKGQITSLIINYFILFWPALIKRGFIKRLNTPIIRSIQKSNNAVFSFNSIPGYKIWRRNLNISDEKYESSYNTSYYKGLGKHDKDDIKDIFMHFDRNLIIYTLDSNSEKLFNEYFSSESEYRKTHLRTPITEDFAENAKVVSVSDHLSIDTKSFKRYVILRMLPHIFDGLLLGRRKVLRAAQLKVPRDAPISVSSLGGIVKSDMNYHHGDSAITDTITKMGQLFFPRIIPLFLGLAVGFGSRAAGGHDMAEARYIEIKHNAKVTDLLFPREDDYLLPYEFEEGSRCEPKYYLPIIPMVLLESQHHPSQGWDVRTWARDWKTVFRNIRRAISHFNLENMRLVTTGGVTTSGITTIDYQVSQIINDTSKNPPVQMKFNSDKLIAPLEVMEMDTTNWHGKIVKVPITNSEGNVIKTKVYSVGTYKYDKSTNTIIITELPHSLTSENYISGNRKAIVKAKAEFEKKEKALHEEAKKKWFAERSTELKASDNIFSFTDLSDPVAQTPAKQSAPVNMTFDSMLKLSSTTDSNKKAVNDIKQKKVSIFDEKHGDDISDDLILDVDKMNNTNDGEFHWETKKFVAKTLIDKEYVKAVYNRSTDQNIEIYVELEDGAFEKIKECASEVFDGVIEYFKLRVAIHDSLNFIDESGYIQEYDTYDQVFRLWFDARKKLYEERIKRNLIITELRIYKLELTQRFCNEAKTGKINISRMKRDEQERILMEANYPKLGVSVINDPKYIPVDQIRYEALENAVNLDYSYILRLTQSQLSEDDYKDREVEIAKLRQIINQLTTEQKYFPGALCWLDELAKLEVVISRGLTEGWGYDQRKKKYT